jgi:serine/threonine protein kinase
VKTVVRDTPDQQQRGKKISEAVNRIRSPYDVFLRGLKSMPLAEKQILRFGACPLLWSEFPQRPDISAKVGTDKPGDGLIYNAKDIDKASAVLTDFFRAWQETVVQEHPSMSGLLPKVGNITSMPKICLVLRGMKQERLLDCFCENQKTDHHLPLRKPAIEAIFQSQDAYHAAIFYAEQHRVMLRKWNPGDHVEIPDEEPLPLIFDDNYRQGSYGMVQRVRDASTNEYYARKEQTSVNARKHLQREIDRLKKLQHRHVVQFVKSYQRGNRFGLLLKPAATTDLERLLVRYHKNGHDYERDSDDQRRDRTLLFPIILTAFGCLSRGLAHIHASRIRHKDIKPANILFEKALMPELSARFLWADFGLAYDFGHAGNSRTRSKSRYSPRYAAPEILAMSKIVAHTKAAKPEGWKPSEEDSDDSEASYEELAELDEEAKPNTTPWHGRSSDIFSFGCVFLEILSVLVGEPPPMSKAGEFQALAPFGRNIDKMEQWAEKQCKNLKKEHRPLRVLFMLGQRMIKAVPEERPVIDSIVAELVVAGNAYFCATCIKEPEDPKPNWDETDLQEAEEQEAISHQDKAIADEQHDNGDHGSRGYRFPYPSSEIKNSLESAQRAESSMYLSPDDAHAPRQVLRSSSGKGKGKGKARSRSPQKLRFDVQATLEEG